MTKVLTQTQLPYNELDVESQKVIDWRLEWLLRDGGFGRPNAERIALDTTVDYRFAIDLLKNSNNEKLTMEIIFGK